MKDKKVVRKNCRQNLEWREKKKRKTVQVRVSANVHRKLKITAKKEKMTMSKLLDEVLPKAIKHLQPHQICQKPKQLLNGSLWTANK